MPTRMKLRVAGQVLLRFVVRETHIEMEKLAMSGCSSSRHLSEPVCSMVVADGVVVFSTCGEG
jgi:hypothetical protein